MVNHYIIPARKGSKGFPLKNRKLFESTANELKSVFSNVIVSSDDDYIKVLSDKYRFKYHTRNPNLSLDNTSIKPVLQGIVKDFHIPTEDNLILLYLTYPERTFKDINNILTFYKETNSTSLLCKEPINQHPYLCFFEEKDNKGKRILPHNLYRRQDYPKCFFGSHFMAIVNVGFLPQVDNNLYHPNTSFYNLDSNKIDVDYELDFFKFKN